MGELATVAIDHHRDRDEDEDKERSNSKNVKKDESSSKNWKASSDERKKYPYLESIDMLMAIFFNLPLFSVLRFLFVSKDWHSVLSDPYFLEHHSLRFHPQRHNPDEPPGALFCPTDYYKHPVYSFLPQNQDQEVADINPTQLKLRLDHVLPLFKQRFPNSFVIGSCNGLLLYFDQDPVLSICHYIIYNPMINKHTHIPRLDVSPPTFNVFFLRENPYLIFDPSVSLSFQVLVIIHSDPFTHFQIHVYSSKTEQWRYIDTIPHDEQHTVHWESVMFNGVFYCVRDDDAICFNAGNDSVSILPLPELPEEGSHRDVFYIGECGGRLLLMEEFDLVDFFFPFTFSITEMVEVPGQPSSWIERFRFNLSTCNDNFVREVDYPSSMMVMHVYETEEALVLSINNRRLISFSLTTNTFGALLLGVAYPEEYFGLTFFPFSPILFPLTIKPFSPTLFPINPNITN